MNVSREDKKQEAVERMRKIGMYPGTIKQFKDDDLVSESDPPVGACYWIDGPTKERVEEFEKKHDALVYHVIRSYTTIGEMETYMYVCDDREEWELDRDDLEGPQDLCYVYNNSDPDLSEFGAIGFEVGPAGGLLRTW